MQPISLLLVDDEEAFTEILALRLGKRGCVVKTALDGATAVKMVEEDRAIEVVVLDIAIPGMDGIETLKAMKKVNPLLEVIMLTGNVTVQTGVESIKLGAYNYLAKPCKIEDITAIIEEAASQRRAREAKILDIRSRPWLTEEKRQALIAAVLRGEEPEKGK
jgi:DNA-binding NtrC family response regulator